MTMLLIYFVSHIIRHNYDPTHNETQSNVDSNLPSIQQDRAARNIIVFIISKGYASPERPRWCRMRCPKTGHIMRHTCTSHVNMLKAMPMLHIYAKDRPNYSTHRIKGFVYSSLNGLLLLPFFLACLGGVVTVLLVPKHCVACVIVAMVADWPSDISTVNTQHKQNPYRQQQRTECLINTQS